jgi:molybdopterin-containing oxidoreductase family iron-sulfur binding subunit
MNDDHESGPRLHRREFLRLAGASIAFAGLDGCTRMPAENILPYVDNRPELTPGVGQHYATAMCVDGIATGLIVESHEGRPTKIEGNPDHPASLGASSAIEQASILQLYDPDRAKAARVGAARSAWSTVRQSLTPAVLGTRVGSRGERLRLLIEPTSSPLEEELLARVMERYPGATIHMYSPAVADRATAPLVAHYDIARADVILSVDADFLASGPFHLRYARQFADNRRLNAPTDAMNRLYAIESGFTPTGVAADHRFAVRPRDRLPILRALLGELTGASGAPRGTAWAAAVAGDLKSHVGRSVVIGGARLSVDERAVVDEMNRAIGAAGPGQLAWFTPTPLIGRSLPIDPLNELVDALRAKSVDTLIIVGGNPVYASPGALALSSLVRSVPNVGYVGLYENETARDANWFVPQSHYLESWGNARAYDGTLSIVQPLVNPLYESIAPAELYASLAGVAMDGGVYGLLRSSWEASAAGDMDEEWATALRRGIVADTAFPPVNSAAPTTTPVVSPSPASTPPEGAGDIEVVFAPDPKVHDGSFSNNAWLQELPSPLTQLAWGNAVLLSPATAKRSRIMTGDVVALSANGRTMSVPVLVVPGHADDTATLHFGYGRTGAESVARGVGADAYQLWPSLDTWVERVSITRSGEGIPLAIAQTHDTLEASRPVRTATLNEYRKSPASVGQRPERVLSLYPEPPAPRLSNSTNQWAMTIDLATCIGCNACVIACQSENNIPVVGPDDSRNARAMHWIRVDRYFTERENEVAALLQPMLCQHCEKAPCEYVCPVEATVHSADGLNEMVYNRCVGTRFCSNNCPYKVRHFNWFDYNARMSETELMAKNPNVTVRERGVMEKCTFCVQRIREGEIAAGREGRELRGSEVRTACQQACPSNAIVFGSLTEDGSPVVRARGQPRAYSALNELGTQPRVRYLARIRNANPDLSRDG